MFRASVSRHRMRVSHYDLCWKAYTLILLELEKEKRYTILFQSQNIKLKLASTSFNRLCFLLLLLLLWCFIVKARQTAYLSQISLKPKTQYSSNVQKYALINTVPLLSLPKSTVRFIILVFLLFSWKS